MNTNQPITLAQDADTTISTNNCGLKHIYIAQDNAGLYIKRETFVEAWKQLLKTTQADVIDMEERLDNALKTYKGE